MSATLATSVGFDPLKDSRHRDARSAREQVDWLTWLQLGGIRPRTLDDYEWATARLMRMFPLKTLGEITDRDLIHVIATFPERSRKVRVAALASWFKWAVRTRVISENPMMYLPEIRKPQPRARDIFTDPEVELLIGLPTPDGALMRILFEAGLRRGEARRLKVKHIRPEPMPGQLVVIDGKGGKDRIVPLTRTLAQAIAELQITEGLNRDDHFWYKRPGGGKVRRDETIGDAGFGLWWTRCLNAAGVRYRNPHTSRHTCATRLRRAGLPADYLQQFLGHASVETTIAQYVHMDDADLAQALAAIYPD